MSSNLLEKRQIHKNDDQGDQDTEDQVAYGIDDTIVTTSDMEDDNSNYGDDTATLNDIYNDYTTSDDGNYESDTTWTDNATDGSYSDQATTNSVADNDGI